MALNNSLPYRQSHRLPGFDYRQPGAYFITVCTHLREPLFGHIVGGQMQLNAAGRMLQSVWDDIPMFYPGIEIDDFIVMPDHVHGIIHIVGAAPCGRPGYENHGRSGYENHGRSGYENHGRSGYENHGRSDQSVDIHYEPFGHRFDIAMCDYNGRPQGAAPTVLSLSDVVHRFKSISTNWYGNGVASQGWQAYRGRLWQRNYWERVLRGERECTAVRRYIRENPQRWQAQAEASA
jgi:putative transposase